MKRVAVASNEGGVGKTTSPPRFSSIKTFRLHANGLAVSTSGTRKPSRSFSDPIIFERLASLKIGGG